MPCRARRKLTKLAIVNENTGQTWDLPVNGPIAPGKQVTIQAKLRNSVISDKARLPPASASFQR